MEYAPTVTAWGFLVAKMANTWVETDIARTIPDLTLTYLLIYSMQQSRSWETNEFSTSQEIPTSYGTRRFITVFTSARHLFLSWVRSIQLIHPVPTSWRSILILSSHVRLGLPNGLLLLLLLYYILHTYFLTYLRTYSLLTYLLN
jgi:hypothetical protein